jgi:RNA polymerase sigma factor (sigma-70 family)
MSSRAPRQLDVVEGETSSASSPGPVDDPAARRRLLEASLDPAEALAAREDRRTLAAALSELPARWRRVLELRFGLDGGGERSHREVGALLGVSLWRARELETFALRRLRASDDVAALRAA